MRRHAEKLGCVAVTNQRLFGKLVTIGQFAYMQLAADVYGALPDKRSGTG